jgi:dephospho-CoA kinase
MLNVGLTGGIASGKSTVAKMLQKKGALLIDLDELSRKVVQRGLPAWKSIVEYFGPEVLKDDGSINRKKLGAIVFEDHEKLTRLNEIVHPAIIERWQERLAEIKEKFPEAIVLSDIPLLIELGLGKLVDVVVLVHIPKQEQINRLMLRNGISRKEALSRLNAQLPIDEKVPLVDIVVNNQDSIEKTQKIVDDLWQELLKGEVKCRLSRPD